MLSYARFTPDSEVFAWCAAPQALPPTLINPTEQTFSLVRCSDPLDKTRTMGEDATAQCALIEPQASMSSVVALVPALTPPVIVRLFDVRLSQRIRDLTFSSAVRTVRLNMKRLVIVLEDQVQIFNAEDLSKVYHMDAPRHSVADCCVLSSNSILAIGAAKPGHVLLFDALNLRVLQVIAAHQSAVACLALSDDGQLLATASETGTIIRVFSVSTGEKIASFRRGARPRTVKCLTFSASTISDGASANGSASTRKRPQFLAVGSDNGTVHVFFLMPPGGASPSVADGHGISVAQSISTLSSYLVNNWLPHSVSDIVEPARCVAYARAQSTPLACAFASESSSGGGMVLRVVTEDGYFREFKMGISTVTELPLKRYKRIIGNEETPPSPSRGPSRLSQENQDEEADLDDETDDRLGQHRAHSESDA